MLKKSLNNSPLKLISGLLFILIGIHKVARGQQVVQPNQASRPNIVFILTDDLGYGDVQSFNPEGKISTPNIDALASEGIKFTDAHASSSVCTPSRYSILTGRYPWRSRLQKGVLGGFSKPLIKNDQLTVASLLKKFGYSTAIFGKWHLGMDWPLKKGETKIKTGWEVDYTQPIGQGPTTRGFDYFYGISASLDMSPFLFIENNHTVGIPTVTKKFFGRKGPSTKEFEPVKVVPTLTRIVKGYLTTQSKTEHPFFLYFALPSPHTPIVPNKAFTGKSGMTKYGDYVMETDWAVGQLMNTLDSLGVADNTIVFFSSDNGFAPYVLNKYNVEKRGHHPSYIYRGYKSDIWEGGHRVPMIARWPNHIKAGSTSSDLVSLTDFIATCANIINKNLPDSTAVDSYSILPDLLGTAKSAIRPAVVYQSIDGNFAIQKGNWKLELCPGSGGWESPKNKQAYQKGLPLIQLYNLQIDPSEKNNVEAGHPQIVKILTQLLKKYVKRGRSTPGQQQKNSVKVNILKKDHYME